MSVTYGFYNSLNHDRQYDAVQMSSIFDGIINDGIFMSIGTCFRVLESSDMMVTVGVGRAWFNHTWTYNDSPLPIEVPQSEVLLDRIDAVVLEVNSEQSVRANSIKIVSGTPSSKPVEPTMTSTSTIHQYPLAYIYVGAGVTAIRQANITDKVGSDTAPYVTGIIETVDIESLVLQWEDQWREFFENQTEDMIVTNADWKKQWSSWFESYTKEFSSDMSKWEDDEKEKFDEWLSQVQASLDGDVATNLANALAKLQIRVDTIEDFMNTITASEEFEIQYPLLDNVSDKAQKILDSGGDEIETRVIFKIK